MGLTNGWDFDPEDHKRLVWKRVREEAPYLLIGSPPCTYIIVLQELNKAVHGNKPGWQEKFDGETESNQARRFLLRSLQVPDPERLALPSRASMDGQILEVEMC